MARIKINDLHKDMKISKEEMKNVVGGAADCFLNIIAFDGVDGEAYADWIEVMSYRETGFSHGVSQSGGGATGPTRR